MLRMRWSFLLVVTLVVLSACLAHATVWTVSSIPALRSAVASAAPGDIIELTDGTYTWSDLSTACTITGKNNLTIRSQSGNRAACVIKGGGISNKKTQFCFKLYGSNYITIENMTLRDVYWHCVQVNEGSSYLTLRNLYMWDAGEGPIKTTVLGASGPFSDYGLVEDCVIGYTTTGQRTVVEGADLIASKGWVIRNTEFYNVLGKGSGVAYGCFAKAASEDTVIDNCYFQNCFIAISFGGGGSPIDIHRNSAPYEHYGGLMSNNVVHLTKDVAIYMNLANGFKVYNNTLWSTFTNGGSSIDLRFVGTDGTIYNNICSQSYRLRDGATGTFANNIFNASAGLFVNQAGADYHLVSTATSAIDQGLDTTADVPYDMDGQTRPRGSAVDIGADEY